MKTQTKPAGDLESDELGDEASEVGRNVSRGDLLPVEAK